MAEPAWPPIVARQLPPAFRLSSVQFIVDECQDSGSCLWEARLAPEQEPSILTRRRSNTLDAGTIARRSSIHRATTVGPKSPLYQVILKNTSVEKDVTASASISSINRSQSLLTTNNRIPVLAPSRGDRARLEALLADVWTREVLPFPGITVRARSEHLVRSSASSVIRKLSVTSIASTFTKRSSSLASINKTSSSDEPISGGSGSGSGSGRSGGGCARQECATAEGFIDVEGESTRSRLSVISDEAGRQSTTPIRQSTWEETELVMGTVRRLETIRLEGSDGLAIPRASSIETLRSASRRAFSRSSRRSPAELPRGESPMQGSQESCTASSIKSVSRWTRVGVGLHRGLMMQGIRSFFR